MPAFCIPPARVLAILALVFLPALALAGGVHPDYRAGRAAPPCDTLFLTENGAKPLVGKVTAVDAGSISYIPCDNLEGPVYTLARAKVHSIRYANGKEELITPLADARKGRGPDGMAIASLLLGVSSLLIGLLLNPIVGVILGFGALALGIAALSRMKRNGRTGRGMAIVGIILGGATILVVGLLVLLIFALLA